ncbi:venom protease [Halyomorpha halys]|uniref:venom protease n=1 Tax=Halyomorpha halys TaxID=286706 RepID=UPI0006D5148A|nr:venom protease [Halyomorpha halys]
MSLSGLLFFFIYLSVISGLFGQRIALNKTQTSSSNKTKSVDGMDIMKSIGFSASSAKSKADKMCEVYSKYVYRTVEIIPMVPGQEPRNITISDCTMEPLIVGGVDAKPKEFPHMALVGYEEIKTRKINWICGGSLISSKFVLTAAHCIFANNRFQYWVRLGDLDTSSESDDSEPVNIRVAKKIIHPQYNDRHVYHDIALFELEYEATFSNYVRPLCLHTSKEKKSDKLVASGWGYTRWEGNRSSEKLQKITLPLVSNQKCNKFYDSREDQNVIPNGIVKDLMLCAGGEEKKDTCQGDSGGPLQIMHKNFFCMYSIVGVVSNGKGCALGYPGIYTRVSNYVAWIVENIWP